MTALPNRKQGRQPKLENFGPELFEIWRKAPLTLTLTEDASAISLRFRLYSLRSALASSELEDHKDLYRKAARLKISKYRRFDSLSRRTVYDLKIYDADTQYKEILDQVGIGIPEPPDLD